MSKKENKRILDSVKAVRGVEREDHFANGGTLHEWRGGLHTITKNKKRERSRKACRCRKNWT